MVMASLSVSLPQVEKFAVQPKTSALATAVPCLKTFAPVAWTRTVTCCPDPVQPTFSKAVPWATPDPERWVTVTLTDAVPGAALQVTSRGTLTAAPRATSVAGDSTWTSRKSPPEKNATAGPDEANSASKEPATRAAASLVRSLVLIGLLLSSGARMEERHTPSERYGRHGLPAHFARRGAAVEPAPPPVAGRCRC